jgi:hypothetical protein
MSLPDSYISMAGEADEDTIISSAFLHHRDERYKAEYRHRYWVVHLEKSFWSSWYDA